MVEESRAWKRRSGKEPGVPWDGPPLPLAVVMIAYNEAHHMGPVLENLAGWAGEVFVVDSYSTDETVDIALRYGAHVVQRRFRNFGDQWNFALRELPIAAPWTMKMDPDERLTDALKHSIARGIAADAADGFRIKRRLWFMGRPLPVRAPLLRIWRTGRARISDVSVNEHPIVEGLVRDLTGDLEHYDSPNLHHWIQKQNRYTSLEAEARYTEAGFAATPKLFGTPLERRMWGKKNFFRIPGRYVLLLLLNLLRVKPWKTGRLGYAWARWRVWVMRTREDKWLEMRVRGKDWRVPGEPRGAPHPGAVQGDVGECESRSEGSGSPP